MCKTVLDHRVFGNGSTRTSATDKPGFRHIYHNVDNLFRLEGNNWYSLCLSHPCSWVCNPFYILEAIDYVRQLGNHILLDRVVVCVAGVAFNAKHEVVSAPFTLTFEELYLAITNQVPLVQGERSVRGYLYACYDECLARMTTTHPGRNQELANLKVNGFIPQHAAAALLAVVTAQRQEVQAAGVVESPI